LWCESFQWRPRIKRTAAIALACAPIVALAAVAAAETPAITQQSIDGARLGLSARNYKKLLGKPVLKAPLLQPGSGQPTGWSQLVFWKRGLSVSFAPKGNRGAVIMTWNRSYKTSAGLGPCSTIAELKLAYGSKLKPSKFSTFGGFVHGYILGRNLIFGSTNYSYVEVIGLYNGSDPNVGKPGGSLSWASRIALSARTCHRD
jgi:hypothetical protein